MSSDNGSTTVKAQAAAVPHTLWQPHGDHPTQAPQWHLHVNVLKDQEGRGDCPPRTFAFKSLHHLTHAANQLEATLGSDMQMNRCGVQNPDAMGGRINDGRTENITIEYDSEKENEDGWKEFLAKIKRLEDEWDHEGKTSLL
ncbi:hypothetical protein B7494_g4084 [Chlorociboria aeruginascens]|nr:hypothetical protein B7494_g4084 [Chlorociboria aeruginascens]